MQKLTILAAIFVLFFSLENLFPLRRNSNSKLRHLLQNLLTAVLSAIVARFSVVFFVIWAANTSADFQFGLLHALGSQTWPPLVRIGLELIILDYLIYQWHRLNHLVPFLWRFHQPHHLDQEMDTSTALRFHFFEIVLSGFFRTGYILAFGFSLESVLIFEVLVTGAAIFHHSNLKIPIGLEARLGRLFITPRRHWVHHLPTKENSNSCYGTVLSTWDFAHQTMKPLESDPLKVVGVSRDETDTPSSRKSDSLFETLISPFLKKS